MDEASSDTIRYLTTYWNDTIYQERKTGKAWVVFWLTHHEPLTKGNLVLVTEAFGFNSRWINPKNGRWKRFRARFEEPSDDLSIAPTHSPKAYP
jgi:hypothetical protein